MALISTCSVRANSLYEVLPGVLRLVDRFFTVFYVSGPFFYRFFTVFVTCFNRFFTVLRRRFFGVFFAGDLKKKP